MVMTEEPVLSQHVEQESVAGLTKLRRRAQGMNVAHALTTRRSVEVDVYQHNKPITQLLWTRTNMGKHPPRALCLAIQPPRIKASICWRWRRSKHEFERWSYWLDHDDDTPDGAAHSSGGSPVRSINIAAYVPCISVTVAAPSATFFILPQDIPQHEKFCPMKTGRNSILYGNKYIAITLCTSYLGDLLKDIGIRCFRRRHRQTSWGVAH